MNNLHRHTPGLDAFRYGFAFSAVKWGRGGRFLGGGNGGFFSFFFDGLCLPSLNRPGFPSLPQ